jgi:hypothetical protein
MQKFLIRFLIFSFLLAIIYFSIHHFHQNNFEARIQAKKELIADSKPVDWVVIGDSQGESCLYLGSNSVNLSMAGADATQQFFFLKRFLQNHKSKAIVSCISPHHLAGQSVDFFSEIVANEGIEKPEFESMLATADKANGIFDHDLNDLNWYLFRYHLHSNTFTELASLRMSNKGLKDTMMKYRGTNVKWGETKKFKHSIESQFFTKFEIPAFNLAYLDSIQDLGKKKNIPVYWLPIPLKSFYPYSQAYLSGYFGFLKSRFGAFYWDAPQYFPASDFGDDFHLNEKGMARYSASVLEFLEKNSQK